MKAHVKIKLTQNLPIDAKHGCTEGKVFDAKFQHTDFDENGMEFRVNVRDNPVEFTGDDGSRCVAFSREYEIVGEL